MNIVLGVVIIFQFFMVAYGSIPSDLCPRIVLNGFNEKYFRYAQLGGVYELQNFTWNDFPVFKRSNVYLHLNKQKTHLYLGPEQDKTFFTAVVLKSSFDPSSSWVSKQREIPFSDIIDHWIQQPVSKPGAQWVEVPLSKNIRFKCIENWMVECNSGKLFFTEPIRLDTGSQFSTTYLTRPGQHYFQLVPGMTRFNRPVFQRMGGSDTDLYLSFREEGTFKGWVLATSSHLYLRVIDQAQYPAFITEAWQYYSKYQWVNHNSLHLRCNGTQVNSSQTCESTTICLNNSTCTTTEKDNIKMVICICPDGFYGSRCEKLKAKCPDPISNSQKEALLNDGTWHGSRITYACQNGMQPDFYYSVCVADDLNASGSRPQGHWMSSKECGYITTQWSWWNRFTTESPRYRTTRSSWSYWDIRYSSSDSHIEEPYWVSVVVLIILLLSQIFIPFVVYYSQILGCCGNDVLENLSKKHEDHQAAHQEALQNLEEQALSPEQLEAAQNKLKKENEEKLEKEKETEIRKANLKQPSLCRNLSFSFQIGIWVYLLFIIICKIGKFDEVSRAVNMVLILAIVAVCVGYVFILFESCCSREKEYLTTLGDSDYISDVIQKIRQGAPTLIMTAECYHYETRTRLVTYTDSNGVTQTRTETYQEKVVTHCDAEAIDYKYWRDVSEDELVLSGKHSVTKIRMIKIINAGDEAMKEAWNRADASFRERNDHMDLYVDYDLVEEIPGFVERMAAYTRQDHKPWWITLGHFMVATLFCWSWAYRWCFRANTGKTVFTIRKKIYLNRPRDSTLGETENIYDVNDEHVKEKVRHSILRPNEQQSSENDNKNTGENKKDKKNKRNKNGKMEFLGETNKVAIDMEAYNQSKRSSI